MELRKGDVVELKSGSPAMTIVDCYLFDMVRCQWFQAGRLEEVVLPKAALVVVPAIPSLR